MLKARAKYVDFLWILWIFVICSFKLVSLSLMLVTIFYI